MTEEIEKKVTTCSVCGNVTLCWFIEDPFSFEIYGDETKDWQCEECLRQSAEDI